MTSQHKKIAQSKRVFERTRRCTVSDFASWNCLEVVGGVNVFKERGKYCAFGQRADNTVAQKCFKKLGVARKYARKGVSLPKSHATLGNSADEWCVSEGRASWHQSRAGHSSGSSMCFPRKKDAEAFMARVQKLRPNEPVSLIPPRKAK